MPAPQPLRPPRPHILVIDDDPFVTDHLKIVLTALGYQAFSAPGAIKGLACAVKYCPRAILLDLSMPDMDGFGFLMHRRKLPEIQGTPVIVLTASHTQEDVRKALDLGAVDYLVKPIDENHLARRLQRIVPSPFYSPAANSTVDWGVTTAKSLIQP